MSYTILRKPAGPVVVLHQYRSTIRIKPRLAGHLHKIPTGDDKRMTLPAGGDLPSKVLGLIIRLWEHSGLQANGLQGSLDDSRKGKGYVRKIYNPIFQASHHGRVRVQRVQMPWLSLDHQIERAG